MVVITIQTAIFVAIFAQTQGGPIRNGSKIQAQSSAYVSFLRYHGYHNASSRLNFNTNNLTSSMFNHSQNLNSRHNETNQNFTCEDAGNAYGPGDLFTLESDPCQSCVCLADGPRCIANVCPELSDSCIEVKKDPRQCCVVCIKMGCDFHNKTYHVGETFKASDCQICKCENDGRTYCSLGDCEPPACVDYIRIPGKCCPVCPRGPNCFAGDMVIPAGNPIILVRGGCVRCRCINATHGARYWLGSDQAKCDVLPQCERSSSYTRLKRSIRNRGYRKKWH